MYVPYFVYPFIRGGTFGWFWTNFKVNFSAGVLDYPEKCFPPRAPGLQSLPHQWEGVL